MTDERYYPMEVSLLNDGNVCKLTNEMGAVGYGIYMAVLSELRQRRNYTFGRESFRRIALILDVTVEDVERVIFDFSLFRIEEEGDEVHISSHYLNRVMQLYEERKKKLSEAGKKSAKLRSAKKVKAANSRED